MTNLKISKKQYLKLIFLVLFILILAAIWGQSLKSIPESRAESEQVTEVIRPYLEPVIGEENVTDHIVRKLAHFTEFFILGCFLSTVTLVLYRLSFVYAAVSALICLAVAAIDETLQLFTGRGAQFSDVILDFCGALTGITGFYGLTLLIRYINNKIKARKAS